ncbi:MAG: PKD domain-containing protein [Desulfosalsimonadaceae bacterium]|nr:PKD domain-containing protein [Desulfosalsimonadaceae bacterium]
MKRLIAMSLVILATVFLAACDDDDDDNNYGNRTPVASAGPNQNVVTDSLVTLNGSGSSDADGDTLTYAWSFTSIPNGSAAVLAGAATVSPTFTPDIDGSYAITLTVNDGTVNSAPDTVMVTASSVNSAPVASAGPDQNVITASLVALNGSGSSDADGDTLTYSWSFTSRPIGSIALLSGAATVSPTFTPDVDGSYVISLTVNDGIVNSAPDTVMVTAASAISFAGAVQPIFNSNCTGCHSAGGIAPFLILTAGSSYGNLVNVPATQSAGIRVIPGSSATSVLYLRISGTSVGARMPFGGSPLTSANQGLIQDWIDEGADNN